MDREILQLINMQTTTHAFSFTNLRTCPVLLRGKFKITARACRLTRVAWFGVRVQHTAFIAVSGRTRVVVAYGRRAGRTALLCTPMAGHFI